MKLWILVMLVGFSHCLVNNSIKRNMFITSGILREDYVIEFDGNENEKSYSFWILQDGLSYIKVFSNVEQKQFTIPTFVETKGDYGEYIIDLKEYNSKLFTIAVAYSNVFKPLPKVGKLEDLPYFYYKAVFKSIYKTLKYQVRLLFSKDFKVDFVKCPKPNKLTPSPASDLPNAMSIKLDQYICGPYENIEIIETRFLPSQQIPLIHVESLEKEYSVVSWRKKIFVNEIYNVIHSGFSIKSYSRSDLVVAAQQKRRLQTVSFIPIYVPKEAFDISAKDQLGLITIPLRIREIGSQKVVDLSPRYPLVAGGWKTEFTLSYSLPLNAKNLDSSSKQIALSIWETPTDISISNLKIFIKLDRLATNPRANGEQIKRGVPAGLIGVPTAVKIFEANNVVKESTTQEDILITYNLGLIGTYYTPIVISFAVVIFLIFMFNLIGYNSSLYLFKKRWKIINSFRPDRSNYNEVEKKLKIIETKLFDSFVAEKKNPNDSLLVASLQKLYQEQKNLLIDYDHDKLQQLNAKVLKTELIFRSRL